MKVPEWFSTIFSAGAKDLAEVLGNSVTDLAAKHTGKKELAAAIEELVLKQFQTTAALATSEISSREKMVIAELTQDDRLTKRMRPILVGSGIFMALLEGSFRVTLFLKDKIDYTQIADIPLIIPAEYWTGWLLAVGVWGIGRSAEKLGANGGIGNITQWITGGKKTRTRMLDD